MIEFILALPFYLLVCFLLAQLTLCMHAVLVVQYAAFVSARSAVVHDGNEEAKATAAAVIACLPISPGAKMPASLGGI